MAKIQDFLQQLKPKKYTDVQLTEEAADFGLDENQIDDVVSHDLARITRAVKRESAGSDTKGLALRVVM